MLVFYFALMPNILLFTVNNSVPCVVVAVVAVVVVVVVIVVRTYVELCMIKSHASVMYHNRTFATKCN